MQYLGYRDPNGVIHILNESGSLPPLADEYEWTMVVQAEPLPASDAEVIEPDVEVVDAQSEPTPRRQRRSHRPGLLETLLPLLSPQQGQKPKDRAQELIDALPDEFRAKLGQLVRAFYRPELPPFPGV